MPGEWLFFNRRAKKLLLFFDREKVGSVWCFTCVRQGLFFAFMGLLLPWILCRRVFLFRRFIVWLFGAIAFVLGTYWSKASKQEEDEKNA